MVCGRMEGIKLRYKNAFSIDSDYDLWRLISLEEHTFPSILNAFENRGEEIPIMDGEALITRVIVADDGYAYERTDYDLRAKTCRSKDCLISVETRQRQNLLPST